MVKVEGVCAIADVENSNGRIYPKEVLQKAVEEWKDRYIPCYMTYDDGYPDYTTGIISPYKNVKISMEDDKVYFTANIDEELPQLFLTICGKGEYKCNEKSIYNYELCELIYVSEPAFNLPPIKIIEENNE